jgi:hypothetical protein
MIIMGFNSLYPRSNYSGNYTIDVRIEAKLPTKWTNEKAEVGRAREEKRRERRGRKSQKKEDAGARKGRKVAIHCVFPMICGSEGSKSRLAKAAGAQVAR